MKNTDQALSKLIEKGIKVAEKTGEFVINQAPDLLKEFYTWHIAQNIFGSIFGILLIFAAYKIVKTFGQDENSWDCDVRIFGKYIGFGNILCSLFPFVFGIAFLMCSIYQLVFIITAPKLYLIEYFVK